MSQQTQPPKRNSFIPHSSFLIPIFMLVVALCVSAQENGSAPQKLNPYTGNAQAIAEGQELYKDLNCYGCHGMRGGGGMGPNLTDETWQIGDGSDANLLAQIREGKGKMPAFKDVIDDDQAWKIIAFVRSLYKGSAEAVKW
jgi:mono/diheme cytochrome c family protein